MKSFVIATAAAGVALGAASASADTIHVTIKNFKFQPAEVTAKAGDTIEWTNEDSTQHTVTADGKNFDLSIPPGGVGSLSISAGEYPYHCRIHPSMKGKVTVTE